jgi:hypothetical protein
VLGQRHDRFVDFANEQFLVGREFEACVMRGVIADREAELELLCEQGPRRLAVARGPVVRRGDYSQSLRLNTA